MQIVITGGLGFIGRNLARHIRHNGHPAQLICIDRRSNAGDEDLALFDEVHLGCYSAPVALKRSAKADVLVHLAADTTVQDSIKNPTQNFENNVIKLHTLLEALRVSKRAPHVIFASTGGAIAGPQSGPVDEHTPARPVAPYGAGKLAAEALLSAYSGAYGLITTALRFSNVYGPLSAHKSSLVAAVCTSILTQGTIQIHGDGAQTRDFVHVDDICTAIWSVIRTGAGGLYQLGTGIETSVKTVVDTLARAADVTPQIRRGPALPGEVRHNVCNIARARRDLGFTPRVTLDRGLSETLDWFRTHLQTDDDQHAASPAPHHDHVRPEILASARTTAAIRLIS